MLNIFKGKNSAILGIDITSISVKILELSGDSNKHIVKSYAVELLPPEAVDGNSIKDIDAVAKCIRSIISKNKITTKHAAIAVPDSSVISKIIQMNDGLTDSELEELVILEADKYIPYPIDEINIDFEVQGHSAKNTAMVDVLIVASRAENVSARVEAVNKAGLDVKIVDVESFAVERSVALFEPDLPAQGQGKIIAVIDIGARYTHLFVLEGLKVIFTREEEFGGNQLVNALAQHTGSDAAAALNMLLEQKLPEDYEEKVQQPFIDNLLIQIKRTLQFFYSTSHHAYVDFILLAGGVSIVPSLEKKVEEVIGIQTITADPFKYMQIDKKVNTDKIHIDAPSLLVCCGLALRHIE